MAERRRNLGKPEFADADIVQFCRRWKSVYRKYGAGGARGAESYVVRFEELVREPQRELKQLAQWLGIEFQPALLTPTVLGVPVSANTSFERSQAIDSSAATSWQQHLRSRDRDLIDRELGDILAKGGYSL